MSLGTVTNRCYLSHLRIRHKPPSHGGSWDHSCNHILLVAQPGLECPQRPHSWSGVLVLAVTTEPQFSSRWLLITLSCAWLPWQQRQKSSKLSGLLRTKPTGDTSSPLSPSIGWSKSQSQSSFTGVGRIDSHSWWKMALPGNNLPPSVLWPQRFMSIPHAKYNDSLLQLSPFWHQLKVQDLVISVRSSGAAPIALRASWGGTIGSMYITSPGQYSCLKIDPESSQTSRLCD